MSNIHVVPRALSKNTRYRRPQDRPTHQFISVSLALVPAVWFASAAMVSTNVSAVPSVAAISLYALILTVSFIGFRSSYPHARLGLCNVITLLRGALMSTLVVPLLEPEIFLTYPAMQWAVFAIASVAFALDGADGWMARRSGLESAFGARFDMETDALFAALLALIALRWGMADGWVVVLGFMRYGFVAAALVLPWLNGPLPERFGRKVVCVVQIAVLVSLLTPVIVPPLSQVLAVMGLVVLIGSFSIDIRHLWRTR